MTLRRQLLVFCALLAALPVVAWQSGRQVESFLREARAQVHLTSAGAMASRLDAGASADFGGGDLYVNRLQSPLQIDGYDGDWQLWAADRQVFDGRLDRFSLSVQLASWQRELFVLIKVRDSTLQRAADVAGSYVPGDHVQLSLLDVRGLTRYRLLPSVPGAISLLPVSHSGAGLPPPVTGSWRENDQGYQIELRLPRALLGQVLDLNVIDTGQGLGEPQVISVASAGQIGQAVLKGGRLAWWSDELAAQLAGMVPDKTRAWLLHPAGWVLASAGSLNTRLNTSDEQSPGGWQQLAYRLLAGDTLVRADNRQPGLNLRLTGPEITAARQGQPKVSWRRVAEGQVQSAAAVPVGNGGAVLVLEQAADPLLLATNRSALRMLGSTLLVVTIVVLGLLAHNTWLSVRIRRLRNGADRALNQLGDTDIQALPGAAAGDEIGDLSRSFSALFGELRSYNRYLKTLASKLSHELNTPLAVVRSSLENLRHETLSEDAQAFAARAEEGAARLRNILRAMSEASRLEQSLEQAEPLSFDLVEVVSGCVEGYRTIHPAQRWDLELPGQAPMNGAPELLAQMLDKLADNASSFCPAGATVKIQVSALRRGWRLVFGNDGPLIPDQLRQQIFQSLVSDRESASDQVHLGLGLHMVRLIVRAHGGRVKARNRRDGSGVEFVLTLAAAMPGSPTGAAVIP